MMENKMLEEWEKRYLHEKDIRDAKCFMNDIEPPKDSGYGSITREPRICQLRFNGKKFFEYLEKTGHSRARYEECSCH